MIQKTRTRDFLKVTKILVDGRAEWKHLKGNCLQMCGNKKQVTELWKAPRTTGGKVGVEMKLKGLMKVLYKQHFIPCDTAHNAGESINYSFPQPL